MTKSSLDTWSKVIDRMADESAKKQREALQNLKHQVAAIDLTVTGVRLLEMFATYTRLYSTNRQMQEQYDLACNKLRREILRRMH